MRILSSGLLLAFFLTSLWLIGSAARPFERVRAEDTTYANLAQIESAGLFGDYVLPEGELSRLEVAVLIQRALGSYGSGQLDGLAQDSGIEAALDELLTEFADELVQLGAPSALVKPAGPTYTNLEQRISYLEEEVDDSDDYAWQPGETYYDQLTDVPCADPEIPATDNETAINISGSIPMQIRAESAKFPEDGTVDSSDLQLYHGGLGVIADDGTWSGLFSIYWKANSEDVNFDEYWVRYDDPKSPLYAQMGHVRLPFGRNRSYFPTWSAVYTVNYSSVNTVGLGWNEPNWGISGYLYNADTEVGNEEDNLADYSIVWDVTRREADECHDGWRLAAGINSNAAEARYVPYGGESVVERNDLVNFYGSYDFNRNRCHLLADYSFTLDKFNPADLDADDDSVGDKPRALNSEFVYEPTPGQLWGASLQITEELQDFAETRYGLLYGQRLNDMAMFKLEYTHGEFGDFDTTGRDSDDTLVAEVKIEF